jgi:hypothetical protein
MNPELHGNSFPDMSLQPGLAEGAGRLIAINLPILKYETGLRDSRLSEPARIAAAPQDGTATLPPKEMRVNFY